MKVWISYGITSLKQCALKDFHGTIDVAFKKPTMDSLSLRPISIAKSNLLARTSSAVPVPTWSSSKASRHRTSTAPRMRFHIGPDYISFTANGVTEPTSLASLKTGRDSTL